MPRKTRRPRKRGQRRSKHRTAIHSEQQVDQLFEQTCAACGDAQPSLHALCAMMTVDNESHMHGGHAPRS